MTEKPLAAFLKWPAIVVGAVVAIVTAAGAITRFPGVPAQLESHVSVAARVHDSLIRTDKDVHAHLESMEQVQRQMWRERATEQCLENEYRMLAQQGLLRTCDSLGIQRRMRDIPPTERAP